MSVKQKNKKPLLYLGVAIFILCVVAFVSIRPFGYDPGNGGNGDELPEPPEPVVITIVGTPELEEISPTVDPDGFIYLRWSTIELVDVYQLYMSTDGGSWEQIKLTASRVFITSQLTDGDYRFKVRGYNVAGYTYMSNTRSVTVIIPPPPPPPPDPPDSPILNSIESPNTDGSISLSWNSVSGADGYNLWMEKNGVDGEIIYSTPEETDYVYETQEDGDYEFKVRAYTFESVGTLYSAYSDSKSVTVSIELPVPIEPVLNAITPALSNDGLIGLDWDAIDDADRYEIYRAENGGDFDPLIEISNKTYYDDLIEIDGTYTYKVKAGNDNGYSGFSNEESVIVQLLSVPESPIINELTYTTISGVITIQLSWSGVDCDSYNVYRKINDGDYILIKEVFSIGYSEALTDYGVYFYRVSATNICGESEMSDFTSIGVIEDREPIVRGEEPPIEPPTDYTMIYVLLVVLGVLAVPVLILIKRKKKINSNVVENAT